MMHESFVAEYLKLRGREGRLYPDEIVRCLPYPGRQAQHGTEWAIRARTARRLRRYFAQRTPLRLLEVGCGNGWLSHYLSLLPACEVMGIDINSVELRQGERLFKAPNLSFRETTLAQLNADSFDCILFAASFQYFADVAHTLSECFQRLVRGGSVHIVDTHFYRTHERAAAQNRSASYFAGQGATSMERYYFHHSMEDLAPNRYRLLNPLSDGLRRLSGPVFPWIQIERPA